MASTRGQTHRLELRAGKRREDEDKKEPQLGGKEEENIDHRIIGGKRPLRSLSPTIRPTPPFLLNYILKCHIYTVFLTPRGMVTKHVIE